MSGCWLPCLLRKLVRRPNTLTAALNSGRRIAYGGDGLVCCADAAATQSANQGKSRGSAVEGLNRSGTLLRYRGTVSMINLLHTCPSNWPQINKPFRLDQILTLNTQEPLIKGFRPRGIRFLTPKSIYSSQSRSNWKSSILGCSTICLVQSTPFGSDRRGSRKRTDDFTVSMCP